MRDTRPDPRCSRPDPRYSHQPGAGASALADPHAAGPVVHAFAVPGQGGSGLVGSERLTERHGLAQVAHITPKEEQGSAFAIENIEARVVAGGAGSIG